MKTHTKSLTSLLAVLFVGIFTAQADFALRDGDTVAFLGDSITAAGAYQKTIETYTLLRFPQRKVRFINAGKGGDTASGSLERIDRDVFQHHATVVVVAFGVNDIGWNFHADAEHKQKYLDGIARIIELCQARKVRVFICSAAITAGDPAKSEDSFLQKMCDDGMALARAKGEGAIDVQRTMREIYQRAWNANEKEPDPKKHTALHVADGIHLTDFGQLAMAFAILKGLGAPADVSSVNLDAHGPKVVSAAGCQVSNLHSTAMTIEFDRLDEGWPLNFGTFGALNFRFIPIPSELNRYTLQITNLPTGKYEVLAGGRGLGTFTGKILAAGLNLSSLTTNAWEPGGPWDVQASALISLTEGHREMANGQRLTEFKSSNHPRLAELRSRAEAAQEAMIAWQRSVAQPFPVHFIVRPSTSTK